MSLNPKAAAFVPRFAAAPNTAPAPTLAPAPTPAPASTPAADSWDTELDVQPTIRTGVFDLAPTSPEVVHQPTESVFVVDDDDIEDEEGIL